MAYLYLKSQRTMCKVASNWSMAAFRRDRNNGKIITRRPFTINRVSSAALWNANRTQDVTKSFVFPPVLVMIVFNRPYGCAFIFKNFCCVHFTEGGGGECAYWRCMPSFQLRTMHPSARFWFVFFCVWKTQRLCGVGPICWCQLWWWWVVRRQWQGCGLLVFHHPPLASCPIAKCVLWLPPRMQWNSSSEHRAIGQIWFIGKKIMKIIGRRQHFAEEEEPIVKEQGRTQKSGMIQLLIDL